MLRLFLSHACNSSPEESFIVQELWDKALNHPTQHHKDTYRKWNLSRANTWLVSRSAAWLLMRSSCLCRRSWHLLTRNTPVHLSQLRLAGPGTPWEPGSPGCLRTMWDASLQASEVDRRGVNMAIVMWSSTLSGQCFSFGQTFHLFTVSALSLRF